MRLIVFVVTGVWCTNTKYFITLC